MKKLLLILLIPMIGLGQSSNDKYLFLETGINFSNAYYDYSIETVDFSFSNMTSTYFSISSDIFSKNNFIVAGNVMYNRRGIGLGEITFTDINGNVLYKFEAFNYASYLSFSPTIKYSLTKKIITTYLFLSPQIDFKINDNVYLKSDYNMNISGNLSHNQLKEGYDFYDFSGISTGINIGIGVTKKIANYLILGIEYKFWHNITGKITETEERFFDPKIYNVKARSSVILLKVGIPICRKTNNH